MSMYQDLAKFAVTQTTAWTVRNPLEALATSAIIANPSTRGLVFKIAKFHAMEAVRQVGFYGRLISTDLVAPASKRAISQISVTASTPYVALPIAAITGAAVGAAISTATVVNINRESNISSSSAFANWSPFGGFGFGTVV